MKIHIKKFFLSGFVIIVFILYSFYERTGNNSKVQAQAPIAAGNNNPSPSVSPAYKDGEYVGAVADAYYGNVQVKAVINGGKMTDVVFLDFPKDRNTSVIINSQATPILRSEALTAQSANVDVVSGATYTSYGFVSSLSSALAQASK